MKKLGFCEVFTIEREYQAGVLEITILVKLENIALLGVTKLPPKLIGGKGIESYSFMPVQKNAIGALQFAKYNPVSGTILFEEVIPYDICEANSLGGWSEFNDLTEEDEKAFDLILDGIVGVSYKAKKVSKQVVNGINYRFQAEAKGVYPGAKPYNAVVSAHIAPDGTIDTVAIF
ncbi:hypothetical protein CLV62_10688 [Dysgonomonas alginatilytica]|uniref:Uncharacterized protein n=1 Tax=Dysgonomonas alginatilytica TaxID=1605892 RepID=A0A2V3PQI9_9BACT|nr:hypothetical protein [Dysgonomonas alginatilytica]PXV65915.1 hypothetical protein CLV62_10688 [Dysgonomonas alginatilytica]